MYPIIPAVGVVSISYILAQIDPIAEGWIQYGVLGLLVVAFLMEWIVPGKSRDAERARADRLEAENARIRDNVETKIIPLVTRSIDALKEHPHSGGGDHSGAV